MSLLLITMNFWLRSMACSVYLVVQKKLDAFFTFICYNSRKIDWFKPKMDNLISMCFIRFLRFFHHPVFFRFCNSQIQDIDLEQGLKFAIFLTTFHKHLMVYPRILHELVDILSSPITVIFNRSIRGEELPDDWKLQYVSTIYKKGQRSRAENYRPISLTCIILWLIFM